MPISSAVKFHFREGPATAPVGPPSLPVGTIIRDAESLAAYWLSCLEAPADAARAGSRAREAVRSRGGALERTLEVLRPLLATGERAADAEAHAVVR